MRVRELIEELINLSEEDKDKEMYTFVTLHRDDLKDMEEYLDEDFEDLGVLGGELNSISFDDEENKVGIGSADINTNFFYTIDEDDIIFEDNNFNYSIVCECDKCNKHDCTK